MSGINCKTHFFILYSSADMSYLPDPACSPGSEICGVQAKVLTQEEVIKDIATIKPNIVGWYCKMYLGLQYHCIQT